MPLIQCQIQEASVKSLMKKGLVLTEETEMVKVVANIKQRIDLECGKLGDLLQQ